MKDEDDDDYALGGIAFCNPRDPVGMHSTPGEHGAAQAAHGWPPHKTLPGPDPALQLREDCAYLEALGSGGTIDDGSPLPHQPMEDPPGTAGFVANPYHAAGDAVDRRPAMWGCDVCGIARMTGPLQLSVHTRSARHRLHARAAGVPEEADPAQQWSATVQSAHQAQQEAAARGSAPDSSTSSRTTAAISNPAPAESIGGRDPDPSRTGGGGGSGSGEARGARSRAPKARVLTEEQKDIFRVKLCMWDFKARARARSALSLRSRSCVLTR